MIRFEQCGGVAFTVAAIAAAVILLITLWGISVLAISPDRLAR